MNKQYGYEVREKETGFIAGDEGGMYFDTEEAAMESAKMFTMNFLIPDEYEGKTLDDFNIVIQEVEEIEY